MRLDALGVPEPRLVLEERLARGRQLAARHRREVDRPEHERPREPEGPPEVVGLGERGVRGVPARGALVHAAEREEAVREAPRVAALPLEPRRLLEELEGVVRPPRRVGERPEA